MESLDLFDLAERKRRAELETQKRDTVFAQMEEGEIRAKLLSRIRSQATLLYLRRYAHMGNDAYVTSWNKSRVYRMR